MVLEDIINKQTTERNLLLLALLRLTACVVVTILLHRGQTTRLRSVTQRPPTECSNAQRHKRREDKGCTPALRDTHSHQYSYTDRHQNTQRTTTKIMRAVPHRHLEATLILREPVCHHSSTRRPAHTREPTHHKHKAEQYPAIQCNRGRVRHQTHTCHHQRGDDKTNNEEFSCIGVIRQATHQKLTEGIGDRYSRHSKTRRRLIQQTLGNHSWGCQREVFADKIVCRITQECT